MLVLPEPFGPTIAVTPPSNRLSVARANVLKPSRLSERRNNSRPLWQMWGSIPARVQDVETAYSRGSPNWRLRGALWTTSGSGSRSASGWCSGRGMTSATAGAGAPASGAGAVRGVRGARRARGRGVLGGGLAAAGGAGGPGGGGRAQPLV